MNPTSAQPGSVAKPGQVRDQVNALIASFLGWALDAFDFFLVPFSMTAIAKEFAVDKSAIAFSITLTLLFRPVGAFLFGMLADRYGRRLPLMIDLVFYSIVEVATGFAPNLLTFLILRALFGIGMGGEWGVGASLALEKVPARWRGVLSGLLQEGYATGQLIAAMVFLFIFPRIGDKVIFHIGTHACYGWRVLFFVGGLPALLALFIRAGVTESEVWETHKHASFSDIASAVLKQWKLMIIMVVLMFIMMCASHGTQDLYPSFLENDFKFSPQKRAILTAVTCIGAILGGVCFGLWSDKIGRRKAMIFAFVLGLLVIPLWVGWTGGLLKAGVALWIGGFLIQFAVQGAWGIIPAHISELSPNSVRGFLPGFAYQMGALLSSALVWIQELSKPKGNSGYAPVMAVTAVAVFAVAILIVALGPEKHAVDFAGEAPGPTQDRVRGFEVVTGDAGREL